MSRDEQRGRPDKVEGVDPVPEELAAEGRGDVPKDLGSRTLSNVGWNSVAAAINGVGQIVYTIIMSRLVSPEAFGLVAMTGVARGIGTLLTRVGIGQALVQKPTLTSREIRAGFTLSVLFGSLAVGVFWLVAPLLGDAFNEPRAVPVIRGASFTFLALGLSGTSSSLMRRNLQFRQLAQIHIVGFLIGYFVIGLGLAIAGAGVWALVVSPIVHMLIVGIGAYAWSPHPIRPTFDLGSYRVLLSFGSRVSLIGIGEFFGNQLDTIVVARYAGASLLGLYNRAFYLAVLPLQMIMNTLGETLFSTFSRIQMDVPRLKRAYLTSSKMTAAIFLPVSAAIGASANELIVVLLGERYGDAAVLVPFFALFAPLNKMSTLCGILLESRGELNKRMLLQTLYIVGLGVAMFSVAGGPLWVYGAVLAGGELIRNAIYNGFVIRKVIPVSVAELFRAYVPGVFAALVMVAAVTLTRTIAVEVLGAPDILALAAEGVAAAATLIFLVRKGSLTFLRNEILSRIPARKNESGVSRMARRTLTLVLGRVDSQGSNIES